MYYHRFIYNANNRLLNLFFLLQEKPRATVSEYTMNTYIHKQMKNEHLIVHLTIAAGYCFFFPFSFFRLLIVLNPHLL